MACYWTGIITTECSEDHAAPPYNGKCWIADLGPQRQRTTTISGGKELVIQASSWGRAQQALELILSCHLLLLGEPFLLNPDLIAHNLQEPDCFEERLAEKFQFIVNLPTACAVAAKVSRRRKWIYALTKLNLSMSLYSTYHDEIDPRRSPFLALSHFPSDHIRFAYAIIAAYSSIEELGLSIIASNEKPSRNKGQWVPDAKQDIEKRLRDAGVDLSETILWILRGSKRKLESKRPFPHGDRTPWTSGIVRDTVRPVIDAIAEASWLRSTISSHKVKDMTRSLSPYDVINVQNLARRLLLESLGFWR